MLCEKESKPQGPKAKEDRASLTLWPTGQADFFLLYSCCDFQFFFVIHNCKINEQSGEQDTEEGILPTRAPYLLVLSQACSCGSTFLSVQSTRSYLKLLEQLMKSKSLF